MENRTINYGLNKTNCYQMYKVFHYKNLLSGKFSYIFNIYASFYHKIRIIWVGLFNPNHIFISTGIVFLQNEECLKKNNWKSSQIKHLPLVTHLKGKTQICEGISNANIIQYISSSHISSWNFAT